MAKSRGSKVVRRPEVKVDQAMKKEWQVQIGRLRAAKGAEMESWDEEYEAVGAILDGKSYLAGGFATARAFIQSEYPDEVERTIYWRVRVARHFDPADETKYGPTRLALLLDYLQASGGMPVAPAKIHCERQRVRVPKGKGHRMVAFGEATTQELQAAIRDSARAPAATRASAPPLVKAIADALRKKKVAGVAVSLRGKLLVLTMPPARLKQACSTLAGAHLTIEVE